MPVPASPAKATAQRCPLCGNANACGMQAACDAQGACTGDVLCWCMTVAVPDSLLQQVPAPARGRSCICADCVAAAHRAASSAHEN